MLIHSETLPRKILGGEGPALLRESRSARLLL
jgi:hypothetical protein